MNAIAVAQRRLNERIQTVTLKANNIPNTIVSLMQNDIWTMFWKIYPSGVPVSDPPLPTDVPFDALTLQALPSKVEYTNPANSYMRIMFHAFIKDDELNTNNEITTYFDLDTSSMAIIDATTIRTEMNRVFKGLQQYISPSYNIDDSQVFVDIINAEMVYVEGSASNA